MGSLGRAQRKLHEADPSAAKPPSDDTILGPRENVSSIIATVTTQKDAYEKGGWNIEFHHNGKKKVINIRPAAYRILDEALCFKNIVDACLKFDPTGYSSSAWTIVSFGLHMTANGKQHREDVFDGAAYLAQLLVEYADIEAQYMRESLSMRGAL
jgi:hypothetical protein